jgi:hypothetical protein
MTLQMDRCPAKNTLFAGSYVEINIRKIHDSTRARLRVSCEGTGVRENF